MLAPSLLRNSSRATRLSVRQSARATQLRCGHHDAHEPDLSHLNRPIITPQNYDLFAKQGTEISDEQLVQNLQAAKATEKEPIGAIPFLNSPLALKCFAEINGTEFHHPLKGATLIQVYKDQLANFESQTAPALEKEGIAKELIAKLHEIYLARAHVDAWEVDAAISRYGFLGSSARKNFRVTYSAANRWPIWKALVPVPFLNTYLIHPTYAASEKQLGKLTTDNEEAAMLNVRQFRGVVAFINAVDRGLTDQERKKVRAILLQGSAPIRLSVEIQRDIDLLIEGVEEAAKQSRLIGEGKMTEAWSSLRSSDEKRYFRQRAFNILPKDLQTVALNEHHDDEIETILEEGTHYFTSEEDRLSAVSKVKAQFWDLLGKGEAQIEKSGSEEQKTFSRRLKDAAKEMLSPGLNADLELMGLLRTSRLTERQQDELLSIFRNDSQSFSRADDQTLLDALNPHPVSQRLFGERIRALSQERIQYTQGFYEGGQSLWVSEDQWNEKIHKHVENPSFHAPMLAANPFSTAMDEVFHMKLVRLATDFYGIDLNTDLGLTTFDQFVHSYDISPGEDTLDRTHTSPPDPHTYEELPIIKFDGWEECDEEPQEDAALEAFKPAVIEERINEWLEFVAKKEGKEFVPLRQLLAGKSLDDIEFARLRAILTAEQHDKDRLKVLKKIWGVVVPEPQLNLLFEEKAHLMVESSH